MKRILLLSLCVIVSNVSVLSSAYSMPRTFADLAERLTPAVVNISTAHVIEEDENELGRNFKPFPPGHPFENFNEFFERFGAPYGGDSTMNSLGSGFIIDAEGHVVTNNHVIEGADEITVTLLDDTQYEAEVVGHDPKTDLALLKIKSDETFPFVTFGNSDEARVGDWVLAIGNPFGLGGTVTAGIISARARDINAGPFDDFLQTDAAINRGNSGGPMFDIDGKVIGINTAIYSPTGGGNVGIGFAVPSTLAEPIIKQLKENGKVLRGWLGVKIQKVTDDIAESLNLDEAKGALVAEVIAESPAEEATIKQGDIITSFDGKDIPEMRKLPRIVAETPVGEKVKVKVWRKGETKTLSVTIAEMKDSDSDKMKKPSGRGADNDDVILGMSLKPLNDAYRDRFNVSSEADGLVVTKVMRGSQAMRKGIRPGDVVVQANQEDLDDVEALEEVIEEAVDDGRGSVLLLVYRNDDTLYLAIPIDEED